MLYALKIFLPLSAVYYDCLSNVKAFVVMFYKFFDYLVNFIDNIYNTSKNTLAKQNFLPCKGA